MLAADPGDSGRQSPVVAGTGAPGRQRGRDRCLERLVILTRGQDREAMVALGIALSARRPTQGSGPDALGGGQALARPGHRSRRSGGGALRGRAWRKRSPDSRRRSASIRNSAQAQCGLGLAYQRLERWEEAAEAFRTDRISSPPTRQSGPSTWASCCARSGRTMSARRALLRAAALEPDDAGFARRCRRHSPGRRFDAVGFAGRPSLASAATSGPLGCPRCSSSWAPEQDRIARDLLAAAARRSCGWCTVG